MTTTTCHDSATSEERSYPEPSFGYDRASWRESAACRQADSELFFPISRAGPALAETQRAKAVCASCPVRQPCLAFALATNQEYGIWGGYDEDERRWLRQRRPGTRAGVLRETS